MVATGDRVRLHHAKEIDPRSIPMGEGTVVEVIAPGRLWPQGDVRVNWDDGNINSWTPVNSLKAA